MRAHDTLCRRSCKGGTRWCTPDRMRVSRSSAICLKGTANPRPGVLLVDKRAPYGLRHGTRCCSNYRNRQRCLGALCPLPSCCGRGRAGRLSRRLCGSHATTARLRARYVTARTPVRYRRIHTHHPLLDCWAANLSLAECRCIQGTNSQHCYLYWELPPLLVFTLQRFRPVHDHHGTFLYAVKVTQAGCHRVTTRNA